jgi:hypothetical protein
MQQTPPPPPQFLICGLYRWCKSQDTLEMKMHMNAFFPYDFAFNWTTFHVCLYKYLYKHIHKYFLFSCSSLSGPNVHHKTWFSTTFVLCFALRLGEVSYLHEMSVWIGSFSLLKIIWYTIVGLNWVSFQKCAIPCFVLVDRICVRKYGRCSGAVLCRYDKSIDKELDSLAAQTHLICTLCQLTQPYPYTSWPWLPLKLGQYYLQ